jgi:hypothetical protein
MYLMQASQKQGFMNEGVDMKTTELFTGKLRSYKVLYLILLMGLVSSLYSQDFNWKNLTRGKLWVSLWNTTGVGLTTGGGEPFRYDYPGYKKGADPYSSYGHVEWAGYMAWADVDGVGEPFRVFNAYDPNTELVVPLENAALIKNYNLEDPTIPAEEMVTGANRMVKYGIDMYFRAMAWSYPEYDDFIIFEYTLVNTGGHDITNFRFAPTAELCISTGSWIGWWRDDDYYEWDLEHEAYYFHDGRYWDAELGTYVDYDYGLTQRDKGDPADLGAPTAITHEFRSAGYFTYYWLDKPEKSDPTERDHMNIVDKNNILQQWTRPQTDPMNDDPEIGVDTDEYFLASLMYDQPPPLTTEDGTSLVGILTDPAPRARGDFEYMIDYIYSTGPYDMAPGDSLKFVMVVAAGMMDYQRVMEGGVENEAHLIDGADSLWAHVDAAQQLYDRGYKLPHPPPTPNYGTKQGMNSLLLTPVPGAVKIQWDPISDTYVDPDYGVNDLAGYRIYQATFRSVGPWTLVKTIPIDSVDAYMDNGLVAYTADGELGVGYYYGVTSYDTGHDTPWLHDVSVSSLPSLESGLVNGNHEPVYPLAAPSDELDDIRVYPNPFKQTSGLTGSGEGYRMEFVNIPALCTIRIYTLAGDLVIKIEHTDESGDEAWGSRALADYQVSQYMQYVAPGIYLFHVESHVSGHEGESKVGKFVIIK